MAKRIVNVTTNLGEIVSCDITNYFDNLGTNQSISFIYNTTSRPNITLGTKIGESGLINTISTSNNCIVITNTSPQSPVGGRCHIDLYSLTNVLLTQWDSYNITNYEGDPLSGYISFVIDDDTHFGWVVSVGNIGRTGRWNMQAYGGNTATYEIITDSIYIPYNWTSVHAISGKNGILSLSTLNDINDGNPVTTSDTNKFYLEKTSNLSTLINNAINL